MLVYTRLYSINRPIPGISGPTSDGHQTAFETSSAGACDPWKGNTFRLSIYNMTSCQPKMFQCKHMLGSFPLTCEVQKNKHFSENELKHNISLRLSFDRISPLLLLSTLWERLHVELGQVPAVLVPAQVPLSKQKLTCYRNIVVKICNMVSKWQSVCRIYQIIELRFDFKAYKHPIWWLRVTFSVSATLLYLSKPHAVPLVGCLLCLGSVHQLEACLIFFMKVGILTAASELRGILIWTWNKYKTA